MENVEDLPNLDHWKTVMEFTVEQAALLMAGFDPFDINLEAARNRRLPRWKQAHGHALGIVSAIRQGLISPVICRGLVWGEGWNNHPEQFMRTVKATDREAEISAAETLITRASLVGWIASENVQITRPPKLLPVPPLPTEASEPITIKAKPEPLALQYHGHKSEGLEYVEGAIKQFWYTFDPDDPSTAPVKADVIEYLKEMGATGNVAQAVDLILRPENMRKVGLRNHKAPTRESQ